MNFFQFIVFAFAALVSENVFLTRALDAGRLYDVIRSPRRIVTVGAMLTLITSLAGAVTYFINDVYPRSGVLPSFKPTVFLLTAAMAYILVYWGAHRKIPELHSLTCVNGVVLASLLICARNNYDLVRTISYCAAAGIGYTGAMLLVYIGKKRLTLCNVPKAFRGFPILLIYIGLLSLAAFGILGHELPV